MLQLAAHKNSILTPIMMTKCPMPKAVIEMISCNCKFSCDTKKNAAATNLDLSAPLGSIINQKRSLCVPI